MTRRGPALKILYHHRTLSKDGQDIHIQAMVAALTRRGHEVILVGPGTRAARPMRTEKDSSHLRKLLPRAVAELLELAYSIPAYLRLHRAWRDHRPDILYERYNLLLLSGIWLRARMKLPLLLEVNSPICDERRANGGLSWPRLARWSEHRVWRESDALLPVTAVMAGHLRQAEVAPEKIHVIANGVDHRQIDLTPDGAPVRQALGLEGKLILGFTGFIRSWHGLPRVVEAMASLRDRPDLHFLIVGDGPGRKEIEERAQRLGLASRLTILGVVPQPEVGAYVAAFDIALQPHAVAYASPLKLFDYMALGRAIIAPDQENIREVLQHDRDALLFHPADEASFRAALARLSADAVLRARLGAAAAARLVSGGYSWDQNAARVEAIALRLIRPRAAG